MLSYFHPSKTLNLLSQDKLLSTDHYNESLLRTKNEISMEVAEKLCLYESLVGLNYTETCRNKF
jgi:hypothetical protein